MYYKLKPHKFVLQEFHISRNKRNSLDGYPKSVNSISMLRTSQNILRSALKKTKRSFNEDCMYQQRKETIETVNE